MERPLSTHLDCAHVGTQEFCGISHSRTNREVPGQEVRGPSTDVRQVLLGYAHGNMVAMAAGVPGVPKGP